ncbi:MAG: hypothetical protein HRU69_11645 [Flammeovirgaceae bacterium]|nr:MAG: hypothetical protein HRU69_11645 [Flammeovirgaceae bacterium]
MTAASKSVQYFAIYLLLLGLALIIFPNSMLSVLMMPETNEPWIRVVGVLVFNLGIFYFYMASTNNPLFLTLSVYLRSSVIVWFAVFSLLEWVSPMIILFGVVDLLAAGWTYYLLKAGK